MANQNQVLEKIQTAQHGTARPFRCYLYKDGNISAQKDFATHHLAWASGANWAMLHTAHTFHIVNQAELDQLFAAANKIYHNFLWNGHNTDSELEELKSLRSQYILKSGGISMPELEYKHFQ